MSSSERPLVGFIGAGAMGTPMISCLAAAGHRVTVFDLVHEHAERAAEKNAGVTAVPDLSEMRGHPVVITMLPDSEAVEAVLSVSGLAGLLSPPTTVVDMSSSEPERTKHLGRMLAERYVDMIDAPVSGGVERARQGQLTAMVGGTAKQVERLRPLLSAMASTVHHVGPLGSGHAVKALNNLLSATGLLVAIEATEGARRAGVDPQTFLEIVNSSTGRNHATETKIDRYVLSQQYDSGFLAPLMVKDLRTAIGLLRSTGTPAGLANAVLAQWERALSELPERADQTEIARLVVDNAVGTDNPQRR